jgi:alanyl-tRNA synthetase
MKSHEIRSSFLKYFEDRGHKIMPSSPLIPQNDPTLLFTNAGMNQFKNVFLGLEKREYNRATSSQKCLRAGGKHNDLENVGFTARHHTFFEMLGNFSFGDYFKEDAIAFAWEFVTKTVCLDPKRLYATVYKDDDEAERLWKKIAPELGDRVLRFGEKDNYWSMGETGPCGPCSEIHYDGGAQHPGELNGEGDRFTEIWNLVFMQFNRDETGKLTPLPRPSVDTGAGLERFGMILQNAFSNYETDSFEGLIQRVVQLSGIEYSSGPQGVSHRVVSDHVRALTFAIGDGGEISNVGRGYVLRRILRRAARHGRLLGLHEPFLYQIVQPLVDIMGGHYTEIRAKQSHIELVIKSEEEQFGLTLDAGIERAQDIFNMANSKGWRIIPGKYIFELYTTYGFPIDLIEIMAKEQGFTIDWAGFEAEMESHREKSKQASAFRALIVDAKLPESNFVGYEKEKIRTVIKLRDILGSQEYLILNETPFYAEAGGQIGDTGRIYSDDLEFIVEDTKKQGDSYLHFGKMTKFDSSSVEKLFDVTAEVDHARRADIKANHTATHLLHKALRMVLGEHVHQAGSLVAPDRLRFDFTHFKAMTPEELGKVEQIVIEKIAEDLRVNTLPDVPRDEAKKMGAMALFGEKYGEKVRVVKTGDFSLELCGGTHVEHTVEIGKFFITQETAIAAGMRRIEAISGSEADKFYAEQGRIISEIRKYLKKSLNNITDNDISSFKNLLNLAHRRMLQRENLIESTTEFVSRLEKDQREKDKKAQARLADDATEIVPSAKINGEQIFVFVIPVNDAKALMVYADSFKNTYPGSTVVTISGSMGNFVITSPDGNFGKAIFKELAAISGGRGGGQPTIRGTMPVEKIDAVITGLKEKFEK